MTIRKVKPDELKKFRIDQTGDPRLHTNLQWFAIDERVIGIVVLDMVDFDFSLVVMTENEQGPGFTAVSVDHSIPTYVEAEERLHEIMLVAERMGKDDEQV